MRKQVHELTAGDLNRFPVWEFALDEEGEEGCDEATVRPRSNTGAVDPSEGDLIIRAVFTLADGTRLIGYLTPAVQEDNSISTLQPVITAERGQVAFWYGVLVPDARNVAQNYEKLDRRAERTFPVRVVSDVDLTSGPVTAEIPAFMTLVYETGGIIETK